MIRVTLAPAVPIATEPRRHAQRRRSPCARALTPVDPSAIVCASPSAHRYAAHRTHEPHPAHLAAPATHSIPKHSRSRVEFSGSVQLIVSAMLTHDGYDPVR